MKKYSLLALFFVLFTACGNTPPSINDNGKPGQIKFIVFNDNNNDGELDPGEAPLAHRIILAKDDTCPPQRNDFREAVTDENGEYLFIGLEPGNYCAAYGENNATTTQMAVKVYLSSEEQAVVSFGIIP